MALITCGECGREISSEAEACPHCGKPYAVRKPWWGMGAEWKSKTTILGVPLVHAAMGFDERGKLRVAKGIIAIGQFGIGLFFAFGQFILAPIAAGQFALGILFALGQFAVGYVATGQVVFGHWGLGQRGIAEHLWSKTHKDPEAVRFFKALGEALRNRF